MRFEGDIRWFKDGLSAESIYGARLAENGCFIKTMETKKTPGTWIDVVANWNVAWKGPRIEILNYVRSSILLPIPYARSIDPLSVYRMHAWLVCRGAGCFDHVAFLDGSDRRLSRSSSSSYDALKQHIYQLEKEHHRLSQAHVDLEANECSALIALPDLSSIDGAFIPLLD